MKEKGGVPESFISSISEGKREIRLGKKEGGKPLSLYKGRKKKG